jgi:hypothetical protein
VGDFRRPQLGEFQLTVRVEGKFTTRNLEPLHEVGGARKKAFGGR